MAAEISICYIQNDLRKAKDLMLSLSRFTAFPAESTNRKPFSITALSERPVEKYAAGANLWKDCDSSTCLIVVCSVNAANSALLDQAVESFIKTVGGKVLPYIVNGIPHARNSDLECLPPSLRSGGEQELFAANTLELSKRHALYTVISAIRGIPLDTLYQSRKQYRRKRMVRILLLLAAIMPYLVYDWYAFHSVTDCFESYVYRDGIPVGVNQLSLLERAGADHYYEFEFYSGRPHSVTRVGEAQQICQDGYSGIMDPYEIHVFRDYLSEDRYVDSLVYRDENGSVIAVKSYTARLTCVDFSISPYELEPLHISPSGGEDNISRCLLTYDENGFVTQVLFCENSRNLIICDSLGRIGLTFTLDANGQILEAIPIYPENAAPN